MSKYFVGPLYFVCPLSCENWQQLVTKLQYFLINNKAENYRSSHETHCLDMYIIHVIRYQTVKMGHKPPNQKSYYCHNHFSSTTVYRPIIIKMSEWKTVTKNTYLKSVEQKRHIIEAIQCRNEWKQKNVRSLKSPTLRFILTLSQLSRLTDVLQIHICLPWRIVASETSMVQWRMLSLLH